MADAVSGGVPRSRLQRAFGLEVRATSLEWMDTTPLSPRDTRGALGFLELTNRYFGGARAILRHLTSWSGRWPAEKTVRLLDVGTGGADIPRAIAAWARRTGRTVHITAIDLVPEIVALARARVGTDPMISIVERDVFALDPAEGRFDYVTASLFFHHVGGRTVETLAALDRLATRGLIISDLARTPAALAGVWILSRLAGNAVVRHDAPLSVRRAFTRAELAQAATHAGLSYLRARPEGPFRVTLTGEKDPHRA